MSIATARTPSTVTVRATCDECGAVASRDGRTAGAAIDELEAVGWAIAIGTSGATCPGCTLAGSWP